MNCYQKLVVVTLCCLAGTVSAQQGDSRSTLANRLDSLRNGWGTPTASAPAAVAEPTRQATVSKRIEASKAAPSQSHAKQTASSGQLPRVDPRDLLPRSWRLSAPASETAKVAKTQVKSSATHSTGSTRARLLRDARQDQQTVAEDRPPVPRAGSVLSSTGSQGPASTPKRSQATSSRAKK